MTGFLEIEFSICFNSSTLLDTFKDFRFFVCLSTAFAEGDYVNLAFFVTLLWSWGSISSPVGYSYLSI